MSRFPLTIINPGAESAIGAEWVNTVGTIGRQNAAPHSGGWRYINNVGTWDYYQEVAIPGTELASIDAGTRTVDYEVWMAKSGLWNPTHQAQLIALDATNVVLQTWSFTSNFEAQEAGYGRFFVYAPVPPLTRKFRLRFYGSTVFGGDVAVWDDLRLGLNDADIITTKYPGYAVTGPPPNSVTASKYLAYGVYGAVGLSTPKYIMYAVTQSLYVPPPTTGGPDPVILPPEDCTDGEGGTAGCCVPEVNGLIETRVGPLNTTEDIRIAIWYLQDRQNVLVREWNKLAAVTRSDFPRV